MILPKIVKSLFNPKPSYVWPYRKLALAPGITIPALSDAALEPAEDANCSCFPVNRTFGVNIEVVLPRTVRSPFTSKLFNPISFPTNAAVISLDNLVVL